jgi:hypothetical protein
MTDTHHKADNQLPTFAHLIALRARVDWGQCTALSLKEGDATPDSVLIKKFIK